MLQSFDTTYDLLKKINTLSKAIEVLLTIIHYELCKIKMCKSGEICVDKKMHNLNVKIYDESELYLIINDIRYP